jgi:hypothetical protein
MILSANVEGLQRVLDEKPADWETRLVLADALAQAGDIVGETAQRWMAARYLHPKNDGTWDWWAFRDGAYRALKERLRHATLPETTLVCLKGYRRQSNWSFQCCFVAFPTRQKTERALGRVLAGQAGRSTC